MTLGNRFRFGQDFRRCRNRLSGLGINMQQHLLGGRQHLATRRIADAVEDMQPLVIHRKQLASRIDPLAKLRFAKMPDMGLDGVVAVSGLNIGETSADQP